MLCPCACWSDRFWSAARAPFLCTCTNQYYYMCSNCNVSSALYHLWRNLTTTPIFNGTPYCYIDIVALVLSVIEVILSNVVVYCSMPGLNSFGRKNIQIMSYLTVNVIWRSWFWTGGVNRFSSKRTSWFNLAPANYKSIILKFSVRKILQPIIMRWIPMKHGVLSVFLLIHLLIHCTSFLIKLDYQRSALIRVITWSIMTDFH